MEKIKDASRKGLKWAEQYTKTDMIYLAKGGFWTILSQLVVSTSTFLLAIAFAHFVSKEIYGQYKYILSIAGTLGVFTLTGLGAAVLRSTALGFEGVLKEAFWKNIKWSVLFFILAFGASAYYFINGNQTLGIAMLIIGSFSPFLNSTNLYDSFLAAKKDFRRSAIYFGIIGNLFPAICIFATLLLTDELLWLISVYFISNTLIGVILYLRVVKIYKPNNKTDSGVVGYSKHLSVIKILAGLANNIDQILIFHYIGAAQLAIYNFALAIPNQIKGPIKGIAGLVFPKFAERKDIEIRKGMGNKFMIVFLLSVLIITAYVFTAPYIFRIFFPKYIEAVFYSQILSISILSIISIPVEIFFLAKEKIKEQYIINILMPIMQIIIMLWFILWWGFIGIVVARVITKILWSMVNIFVYQKTPIQETTT